MRTAAPSLLSCSSTASVARSLQIWREYQWPDFRPRASSDPAPTAPRRRRRNWLVPLGLAILGVLGIVAVVLTVTTIVKRVLPVAATPTPVPHAPSATTAPALAATNSPQATGSYATPLPSSNDRFMYAPDPYTIVFPFNSSQEEPRSTKVSRFGETESPTDDEDDVLLPEENQVHAQLARLRNAMGMENVPFYSREIALRIGSLANNCSSYVNATELPQIVHVPTVKCSADACVHTLGPIWTWFEAGFAQWNETANECMQPASHACRALRGWLNPDLTEYGSPIEPAGAESEARSTDLAAVGTLVPPPSPSPSPMGRPKLVLQLSSVDEPPPAPVAGMLGALKAHHKEQISPEESLKEVQGDGPADLATDTCRFKRLGKGAGGAVYLACYLPSLQLIAIKEVVMHHVEDQHMVAHELHALHDNLVPLVQAATHKSI
ncbi:hypothetical protein SPRG_18467, partial [Saprolegnia parasitica CBS 223.65]